MLGTSVFLWAVVDDMAFTATTPTLEETHIYVLGILLVCFLVLVFILVLVTLVTRIFVTLVVMGVISQDPVTARLPSFDTATSVTGLIWP